MSSDISVWYDLVLEQMAAEAYFEGVNLEDEAVVKAVLRQGNNRPGFVADRITTFTDSQSAEFVRKFRIIDQWSDNPTSTGSRPTQPKDVGYLALDGQQILANTGLSATLIRRKDAAGQLTNEYTLAIRSTEYREVADGGDRDRDVWGADVGGIVRDGFALAQLDALESYYAWLKDEKKLPQGAVLDVTGYSLGGHLATVFAENHAHDTDVSLASAYTFNGAGRGTWSRNANDSAAIIAYFHSVFANPEVARPLTASLVGTIDNNYILARSASVFGQPVDRLSLYSDPRYLWARAATIARFGLGLMIPVDRGSQDLRNEAATKITQLYGKEFPVEATGVANSGVHGPALGVFAEAQPLFEGWPEFAGGAADYGNAHAIVLIADSLALMRTYQTLDPSLTLEQLDAIFSTASNKHAVSALTGNGNGASAEDDALENTLDGLRRVFLGQGIEPTQYQPGAGGAGDFDARNAFYQNLAALEGDERFQAAVGKVSVLQIPPAAVDIEAAARGDIAYRYALETLSPIAVTGLPELFAPYNTNGELDVFNPSTGKGAFTTQYLKDRAAMLAAQIDANTKNSGFSVVADGVQSVLYQDLRATATGGEQVTSAIAFASDVASDAARVHDRLGNEQRELFMRQLYERQLQQNKARKILFGHDVLTGGTLGDDLFGGAGNDTLRGGAGDDYLQGDAGDDHLIGGTDGDTLLGGAGDDILDGGAGSDKYYFYTGGGSDTVIDLAEGDGPVKKQLGELYFNDVRVQGRFLPLDHDKKDFTLDLSDVLYRASYFGDVNTATPGKLMLWNDSDGSSVATLTNFISGDFGIELDLNAPVRVYTDKLGTDEADNSFLIGVPHQESLASDAPAQRLFGYAGSDYIAAAHDNDVAYGGEGDDYVSDGAGRQELYGQAGRDVLVAFAGDDELYGGDGDDALQGGAGRDSLNGGDGNDVLDGGAGEDVIAGGDGDDFIFGGGSVTVAITSWNAFAEGTLDWGAFDASGDVLLRGLAGLSNIEGDAGDVITAGAGNDRVFAGGGTDTVSGGEGNDYLVGQAGDDSLSGDDGDDALYGDGAQGDLTEGSGYFSIYTLPEFHGSDTLYGGGGNDFLAGDGGADDLYGGDGDDILVGDSANVPEAFHGADYLDGGAGNDRLIGYGKNDTLFGGAGNDELGGDSSSIDASLHGDDTLDGGDGDDILHGDGGSDTLFGGAGDDLLDGDASNVAFAYHGDDTLDGEDGDDTLQGGGGSDRLFGGAGDDSLLGDGTDVPDAYAGDDYLDGEAGHDILEAGAGNDILIGGPGEDTLRGQAGDDTYYVSAGDQSDFVEDREGANRIVFDAAASYASVYVFQTLGSDGKAYLGLRYSMSDSVYVEDGLTNDAFSYEFADGTIKTAADWRGRLTSFAAVSGGSGADDLAGTALANLFIPSGGDDTIEFGPGAGFDRVSGFGQTPEQFQGVDRVHVGGGLVAGDLEVARDLNGNLTLTIRGSGERLQLDGWAAGASAAQAGYEVEFDDGSGLTAADLVARALVASDGNDVLIGGSGAETLSGGAGDDYLFGNNNSNLTGDAGDANVLLGGDGNDHLTGGVGADLLDGGPGDDVLQGGYGADRYLFGAGDGRDVLSDNGGEGNVVVLKAGIAPQDVTLFQGSIVIALNASGDTLTIEDWYREDGLGAPSFAIDALRFADGTEWDAARINQAANHATPFADTLRGIHTGDVLYGLGGDDSITGYAGDDVLSGGDGDDVLDGGIGADDLDGGAGDDSLAGGDGNDVLDGGAGDDGLAGGQGDDVYLIGAFAGSDLVVEDASDPFDGSFDVIRFVDGIRPQDVGVVLDGNILRFDYGTGQVQLALAAAGDELVSGIEQIRFDDGTAWRAADLVSQAATPGQAAAGTVASEVPAGSDDTLGGGPGDDVLAGGYGNDTYLFGFGSGHDTIREPTNPLPPTLTRAVAGDHDRILFSAEVQPEDVLLEFDQYSRPTIRLAGSGDTLSFDSWGDTIARVEYAEFADGTIWDLGKSPFWGAGANASVTGSVRDFGTAGSDFPPMGFHDEIYFGLGGADTLNDASGSNTLYGDESNDSFLTGAGDDVLDGGAGNDRLSPGTGDNVIRFGRGSGADSVTLTRYAGDLGSDTIAFAEGVLPAHVMLRNGPSDALIVELAGSPDSLTLNPSFFAPYGRDRLRFEFADGTTWDAAEIAQHIQALAVIEGGTGNDALTGGDGDDLFIGGEGNDTLTGGGGRDNFLFYRGDGTDSVIDEAPHIVFGAGIAPGDVALSGSNFQLGQRDLFLTLAGGGGQVIARNWFPAAHEGTIEFADGTVWDAAYVGARIPYAFVSSGRGTFSGTPGDDSYALGASADTMRGYAGDDTLSAGAGEDSLQGDAGDDLLYGGEGDDLLAGGAGDDLLDGGVDALAPGESDDDTLNGGAGDDILLGRLGSDVLTGDAGDDVLDGGPGDDQLSGGAGDDTLDGGPGDDRLYGGQGSDRYLFGIGSGNDTLVDFDAAGDALDTVRMGPGVRPGDVSVERRGLDLVLRLAPGGDSLAVRTSGRQGYGVERVVFDDGTEWTAAKLQALASPAAPSSRDDVLSGSAASDALPGLEGDDIVNGAAGADLLEGGDGDDILLGGDGDDTLDGGAGFDTLYGGAGADTFVIGADSGSDSIADFEAGDTLSFGPGIDSAEVQLSRDREHLYLDLGSSGQFLTLENWFARGAQGSIAFDDGTVWDGARLAAAVNTAGDGDDFLVGGAAADTIAALAGLDTVYAGAGDDVVSGGDDADTLYGEDGADTLLGEAGYDLLAGGPGDDLLDGGADDDRLDGDDGNDTLVGGDGYDELFGGSGDDVLDGGAGDDLLDGGSGNDRYVFAPGFGADTIAENDATSGNVDSIRLTGIAPEAVAWAWIGDDYRIEIAGSTDRIELPGAAISAAARVERMEFDDGTIWDQAAMYARMARYGTEGSDSLSIGVLGALYGLGGDDLLSGIGRGGVLDGGAGNDRLTGGAGSDTYVFGAGYGQDTISSLDLTPGRVDALQFAAQTTPQQVSVEREGNHLRFALDDGTEWLRVENWFSGPAYQLTEIRFADGTLWSAAEAEARIVPVPATEGDDVLIGMTGPDTIDGLGGDDRIEGGFGDDVLSGGAGNDTLIGGAGNDLYRFGPGSGFDTVIDSDATPGNLDAVMLDALPSEVTVSRDFADLDLALPGGADRLTLQSWFSGDAQRIEQVRLGDGTVWDVAALFSLASGATPGPLLGSDAPEYISGTPGADTLDGLGGNDTLAGGAGNDSYRFGPGYGRDTIVESDATAGNLDVVEMAALPTEVEARRAGADLELRLASGDALVVSGWFSGAAQKVERVRFTDASAWDVAALDVLANTGFTYAGTAGADVITASEGPDRLEGLDGNDQLDGAGGDDLLIGGPGFDLLRGGAGDDVYQFSPGDGFDVIIDSGGLDTLQLGPGIAAADVALSRAGADLTVAAGGESIQLPGWFSSSAARVEQIRFDDGTLWSEGRILAATEFTAGGDFVRGSGAGDTLDGLEGDDSVLGGPGDDSISGSAGNDLLDGEAGDDILDGGEGRDLLVGGPGDDRFVFAAGYGQDRVVDSGGTDRVQFGAGIAFADVIFTRDLANLYASAATDTLTLVDWFASPESRIESFSFDDGTLLSANEVRALIHVSPGTSLSDTLFGSDADDVMSGGNGEDALYGEGGGDVLDGGPGSDYLFGGAGDDLLEGGPGNDNYLFDRGDGNDEIAENDATPGNRDRLRFAAGIAPQDVRVTRESDDVRLRVADGGGSVLLRNWYLPEGQVESVVFADGTSWDAAAIDALANLPANSPPELAQPLSDQAALEDALFIFTLPAGTFLDPDPGDLLSYNATLSDGSPLPAWLAFDPASATFFGTPGNGDVGTLEITLAATDGDGESVAGAFALEVINVNDAPYLAAPLANQTVQEGQALAFSLAGAFADADAGDSLTYAATLADGAALPAWLAFDPASASFNAAPGFADGGSYALRVVATDAAGASAQGELTLDVLESAPPVDPGGYGHHGHHGGDEDDSHHHGKSHEHEHDEKHDRHERDHHGRDLLCERLARSPKFDFSALARELERRKPRETLSPDEIRRSWARVARYVAALGNGEEDFAHGAAGAENPLRLAAGGGRSYGYDGSIGAGHAPEGFASFKGLSEGFRRL